MSGKRDGATYTTAARAASDVRRKLDNLTAADRSKFGADLELLHDLLHHLAYTDSWHVIRKMNETVEAVR